MPEKLIVTIDDEMAEALDKMIEDMRLEFPREIAGRRRSGIGWSARAICRKTRSRTTRRPRAKA